MQKWCLFQSTANPLPHDILAPTPKALLWEGNRKCFLKRSTIHSLAAHSLPKPPIPCVVEEVPLVSRTSRELSGMASLEPVGRSREAGELSCCILGTVSRPAAGRTRACCVPAAGRRGQAGLSLTSSIFKETPAEGGAKGKNAHSSVCHAQLLQLQLQGSVFMCQ